MKVDGLKMIKGFFENGVVESNQASCYSIIGVRAT